MNLPAHLRALASFYDLEGFGAGLVGSEFTRMEMVQRLVGIIRNSDKDGDKIRAMQLLHAHGLDLMDVNGLTTKLKETHAFTNERGEAVQQVAERRTLSKLLIAAAGGPTGWDSGVIPSIEGVTVKPPDAKPGANPKPDAP